MWLFTIVIILIILPTIFYYKPNKSSITNNEEVSFVEKFHIFVCFVVLFFILAFRGDFATDYNAYFNMYKILKNYSIREILDLNFYFEVIESGYALINIIINYFTDNEIWLFIITSIIILMPIYKSIIRDSEIKWLSILLFLIIGTFYDSFNIMRQIMAASIVFAGSKYLYNKNYMKYLIFVFIGTMFHVTTIFMSVFYFLLILKPRKVSGLLFLILGAISYFFMDEVARLIDLYLFNGYYFSEYSGIGMSSIAITNAVVPFSIGLFTLFFRRNLNLENLKHRVWFNGTLLWVLFEILSTKIFLISRISTFFSPFVLLLIPCVINNIKDVRLRLATIFPIIGFLLVYFYFIIGEKFSIYYFFVSKN